MKTPCKCAWGCHLRAGTAVSGNTDCENPGTRDDGLCDECRATQDACCHCRAIAMSRGLAELVAEHGVTQDGSS